MKTIFFSIQVFFYIAGYCQDTIVMKNLYIDNGIYLDEKLNKITGVIKHINSIEGTEEDIYYYLFIDKGINYKSETFIKNKIDRKVEILDTTDEDVIYWTQIFGANNKVEREGAFSLKKEKLGIWKEYIDDKIAFLIDYKEGILTNQEEIYYLNKNIIDTVYTDYNKVTIQNDEQPFVKHLNPDFSGFVVDYSNEITMFFCNSVLIYEERFSDGLKISKILYEYDSPNQINFKKEYTFKDNQSSVNFYKYSNKRKEWYRLGN
jgi:hypothetical protein